uniref:Interleukin 12 receptor, beta 2a n=1 Tax=Gasterosteus aculeatus aculeatus TaxID=481459 RepID=G3PNI3_GASAC|nr:interleukin-12 receptor subunit beta-2 isoform X1 [Gasterosteus aculeatus aculeatus]
MTRTWSFFPAVALLALRLCAGMKSCSIWLSSKPVVQIGSSFQVYCTFKCRCTGAMYSDHPRKLQRHQEFNSTTVFVNVTNITKNITYSCDCKCAPELDPCGLDISAGYLPELPQNLSCIYEVKGNQSVVVFCTWSPGRDTFLWSHSVLWVTKNHIDGPTGCNGSSKEAGLSSAGLSSAGFTASSSDAECISVQVEARNILGSVETPTYQLWDIASPSSPVLGSPRCSSRRCIIGMNQSVWTQHVEIQFTAEPHIWTSSPDQVVQTDPVQTGPVQYWSVSSLEPFTFYQFRARSRLRLWSRWSANVSGRTQEEAPAKELDVWVPEAASDFKSLRVYWKPLSVSSARGRILGYTLRVSESNFIYNVSADVSNRTVTFCEDCEVTVWAINSKGKSPPATITTPHRKVKPQEVLPPQDVHVTGAGDHSVCISWRRPDSSPLLAAYVVEWYREGNKMEDLQWVRLGRDDNHTVVTGLKPFECYEGAVHVVYNQSSVGSSRFLGVSTGSSAPSAAPSVQETVEGNQVTVTWTELPRGERRGCLTIYTIYLEMSSSQLPPVSVPAAQRKYIIRNLSPARYSLWMTASTAGGEGRAGQKVNFSIQHETRLFPLVLCAVVGPVLMVLVCLYHSSAVKQRFRVFFQCLVLDVVPDPANSKWAKDSLQGKGKMNLQLQLSNSSGTEEEEEPDLVDVEELLLPPPPSCTETELLHPQTNYIKSFSHDSDSSAHTQTSLDSTVDYISSHGPGHMEEEVEEEEEDQEPFGFFPSHNLLTEPMEFGGKLTLNAVRIDCSDFLLSEA